MDNRISHTITKLLFMKLKDPYYYIVSLTSIIEITYLSMLSVGFCFIILIFGYLPVFSSKCGYLLINATGMENTHICRHFANLVGSLAYYLLH